MDPLIIAGLVVAALALAWVYSKNSTVAQTPVGGVTVTGTPSADTPLPPSGTPATVATVTPPPKLVKKIVITKEAATSWLNIGEVYAYEGSRLLTSSDFSDAILFPDTYSLPDKQILGSASYAIDGKPETIASSASEQAPFISLTLVLKNPTALTQINVLNRQDCCWDRLEGAILTLMDDAGNVLFKQTLHGVKDLQLFPVALS